MICKYRLNTEHKKYNRIMKAFKDDEKKNLISNLKMEGTENLTLKGLIHTNGQTLECNNDYVVVTFDNSPKINSSALF